MLRLRARTVHPVTAPPIEDGAVLVDDRGTLAAVGPNAAVPSPSDAERLEFPAGTLVPGLVNCHTHLELTHLAGRIAHPEFASWIRAVRTLKDETAREQFCRSAEHGVRDCWARGITCVADTGSSGAVIEALSSLGGRGIVYQEVFGPDPRRVEAALDELERTLSQLERFITARVALGVSPHAPYTVSAPLYRAVAALARRERFPVAVHVAESPEETLLVRDGAGPFADALRERGIAVERQDCSPVQYLERLGVLSADTLCIHCIQLDADDVRVLRRAGAAVAHCPRSNRAHGHGAAPFPAMRAAGLHVGLGTDSVVSVGELDLVGDARAAGLSGEDAVRALTLEGARALGLENEIGSLQVGKQADLAVFPSALAAAYQPLPPAAALLTVVAGRVVHR
ncbi:MAG TPA: amidohydrolase family protein [Gemmatimonadales bacterium]|nr:amidohydrolase family protein [Gemmatimonadales bacterium]